MRHVLDALGVRAGILPVHAKDQCAPMHARY